jgi:hypothetical protein
MGYLVRFLVILSLLFPLTADRAHAAAARNIVEQGLFSEAAVGRTYYLYRGFGDYPSAQVQKVDIGRGEAQVLLVTGQPFWVKARNLYTHEQMRVATRAESAGAGAAAVGVGALLLCAMTNACGGGGGGGGGGGAKANGAQSDGCWRYTGCPGPVNVNKQMLDQCLFWSSTESGKDSCLRQYCSDRYFDYGCNDR